MITVYVEEAGKWKKVDLVDFGRFVAGQTEVRRTLMFEAKEDISDCALTLEEAREGISVTFNGKGMEKGTPVPLPTVKRDSTLLQGDRSLRVELVIKSTDKVPGGMQPVKFKLSWLWPA